MPTPTLPTCKPMRRWGNVKVGREKDGTARFNQTECSNESLVSWRRRACFLGIIKMNIMLR